eukprot:2200516-Pleurochrysis_carterae.AAC.1
MQSMHMDVPLDASQLEPDELDDEYSPTMANAHANYGEAYRNEAYGDAYDGDGYGGAEYAGEYMGDSCFGMRADYGGDDGYDDEMYRASGGPCHMPPLGESDVVSAY